jgi:hypothetical protein
VSERNPDSRKRFAHFERLGQGVENVMYALARFSRLVGQDGRWSLPLDNRDGIEIAVEDEGDVARIATLVASEFDVREGSVVHRKTGVAFPIVVRPGDR